MSRYVGHAELGEPGPFGYTVRVLPSNPLLPNPTELGLVAVPAAAAGMVNGDLRWRTSRRNGTPGADTVSMVSAPLRDSRGFGLRDAACDLAATLRVQVGTLRE